MPNRLLNAIFLIAICALSTGATAQITYKCGNAYSQLPCAGGVTIEASDQRTNDQKTQADMATGRNARTADAMEKARLRQEKLAIAANTPPAPTARTGAVSLRDKAPAKTKKKQKKQEAEYFTAMAPDGKAITKAPNKRTKTKSASKT